MGSLTPAEVEAHIKQWKPLVAGFARQFQKQLSVAHDFEDTLALGMVFLWKAAERFDEQNEARAKFPTYAKRVILHGYLCEVKKLLAANRRVAYISRQSLDATNPEGQPYLTPRDESLRDPEAELVHQRAVRALAVARTQLPVRHQRIVRLRFEKGLDHVEIGAQQGVSRGRIGAIEKAALKSLRRAITMAEMTGTR